MKKLALVPLLLALALPAAAAEEPTIGPPIEATVAASHPLIWSGVIADAIPAELPEGVLASSGGVTVTSSDVEKAISCLPAEMREQARKYPQYVLEQTLRGGRF